MMGELKTVDDYILMIKGHIARHFDTKYLEVYVLAVLSNFSKDYYISQFGMENSISNSKNLIDAYRIMRDK